MTGSTKIYKLTIYICTDGDYYYENSLLGTEDEEHVIYYNERNKAVNTVKTVYSELASTIESSRDYMQDTVKQIKNFEEYLSKIVDKMQTFCIEMPMGNQEITIELIKCEEIEFCGGNRYKNQNPYYTFWIYNNFKEAYNWNVLDDMPVVE